MVFQLADSKLIGIKIDVTWWQKLIKSMSLTYKEDTNTPSEYAHDIYERENPEQSKIGSIFHLWFRPQLTTSHFTGYKNYISDLTNHQQRLTYTVVSAKMQR